MRGGKREGGGERREMGLRAGKVPVFLLVARDQTPAEGDMPLVPGPV